MSCLRQLGKVVFTDSQLILPSAWPSLFFFFSIFCETIFGKRVSVSLELKCYNQCQICSVMYTAPHHHLPPSDLHPTKNALYKEDTVGCFENVIGFLNCGVNVCWFLKGQSQIKYYVFCFPTRWKIFWWGQSLDWLTWRSVSNHQER